MLRLFISLYLVIIIGISAINWLSERLWLQLNDQEQQPLSSQFSPIAQLTQALPYLIKNEAQLIQLKRNSALKINEIPLNNIAWLNSQLAQMDQGQVVVNYNQFNEPLFYVKSSNANKVYQVGPISNIPVDKSHRYLILVFSYFILAIVIAFWTRPIWRDLQRLANMAEQIDNERFTTINHVQSRSVISPIVNTINQMAKRIQKLLLEQKQLINAVSHELRTPLSRLRFSVALIENLDKKQQTEINQDINEVENLVEEMLSYSRLEYVAKQQTKSHVDISQLLNNQIEKLQRGCSIKLVNHVQNSMTCFCNGQLLERATQNLITNAIRYANSEIIIATEIIQQQLQITIADDGCGISKAQSVDLFKPFTRVDKSRNKEQGGYGLGLAIVQKVMDFHNGKCLLESSNSGGALFKLILPLKT
ncbi:ATP-binding protein [Colwelliaceae bacterium 6441]